MNIRALVLPCLALAFLNAEAPLARLQGLVPPAERTQVMVLGTFHFSELKDRFKPEMVEPVLRKLEAFHPDVIAVEQMPGDRIHEYELRAKATETHQDLLDRFAGYQIELGHAAQGLLGLDPIQAAHALAKLPAKPQGTGERVQRTLHLLATYELPSALLAWSRIAPSERAALDGIPASLKARLEAQLSRVNEVPALAIPLARRLGHTEIACVDEFEDIPAAEAVMGELEASMAQVPELSAAGKAPVYQDLAARLKAAADSGDLLPLLRHMNSPAFAEADVDAQWGVYLRVRNKVPAARGRLTLWENRNLKIAARIQALHARYPGKRILVIYGAAHKPFLEAYLSQCSGVQLVQPCL